MSTHQSQIPERVTNWVTEWLSSHSLPPPTRLELLAGDGSPRQFFRVILPTSTYVVMSDPDWGFSKDYAVHQGYLAGRGIPVPAFHQEDPRRGFLLMEDLGDELLQARIQKEPARRMHWLREATALLARLHGSTYPVPPSLPAAARRFDVEKYGEELAFTFEHLAQKFLGLPPPTAEERERARSFCADLERIPPPVFCHRDYHCRNLLVHRETLSVIDFQDARLGAPHYDLASLVYDPYVGVTPSEREDLCAHYRQTLMHFPVANEIDWKTFPADLEAVALQRLVKAAGSFASFFTRYGKTTHLPYLVPALTAARELGRGRELFPLDLWIRKASERVT